MLFWVLHFSTVTFFKSCQCDVLCMTLIFQEFDVVPPRSDGRWFFSGSWLIVRLTTRPFWLFEISAFGFLLASSMIYLLVTVTFYGSTLMLLDFSILLEHFLLSSIMFWFFPADADLVCPSFHSDVFGVWRMRCVLHYFAFVWLWCAAPVLWNMIFYDAADY